MAKSIHTIGLSAVVIVSAGSASAVQVIDELLPGTPTPAAGSWYLSDVRANGEASLVDLVGLGGDLENNQPLPTGALKLTTGNDTGDKAEVGTFDDFGDAATLLTTMTVGYSYHKATVGGASGPDLAAAPAIKLSLFAPGGSGDNFGQLVYEPTWNQPGGGSQNPPVDAWQAVVIDASTGGADGSSTGGWWWTGGFEIGNSFGGPPIKSLAEWAADFAAADPDFANARVVGVSLGVGTFNKNQVGYVDQVTLTGTLADETYDFQVPEPGSFALVGLGGLALMRRRRA